MKVIGKNENAVQTGAIFTSLCCLMVRSSAWRAWRGQDQQKPVLGEQAGGRQILQGCALGHWAPAKETAVPVGTGEASRRPPPHLS